jgi:parallel beta-helix repeat protein
MAKPRIYQIENLELSLNVANTAYAAANAAANLVAVYANNSLRYSNANLNFNNTSTVNVVITQNTTNKAANIEFNTIFTQAGAGADTRSLDSKLKEFISITDYGADNTGNTDSTTAFNEALTYAATINGSVLVPNGTFRINGQVVVPNGVKSLVGDGGVLRYTNSTATIQLNQVSNCRISGLTIDANDSVSSDPIIWVISSNGIMIDHNRIYNMNYNNRVGILLRTEQSHATNSNNIIVAHNSITGNLASTSEGSAGISLDASGVSFSPYAGADTYWKGTKTAKDATYSTSHCVITGNRVDGGYYGIGLSFAKNCTIVGNNLRNNERNISVQNCSNNNTISDNTLEQSRSSAVHLAYGSSFNLVEGNNIYSDRAVGEGMLQAYVGSQNNSFIANRIKTIVTIAPPLYHMYSAVHCSNNEFLYNTIDGDVQRAYIAVESSWNEALENNPASRAYNRGGTVGNNWANVVSSNVSIVSNIIYPSNTVPVIYFNQVQDTNGAVALANTRIIGNMVAGNGANTQLELDEYNSGSLRDVVCVNNAFAPDEAGPGYFSFTRGRAHFARCVNNVGLNDNLIAYNFVNDSTPSVAYTDYVSTAGYNSNTSITYFDDGVDGQIINVRLSVYTTIVHDDTKIRLRGSANVSSVNSNQFITFQRISDIWFELNRSWSDAGTFTQGGANAVTRSIETKLREGWISVKDFGAVGNGVANDTIAVQDAINYANTLGGGVVYFPEGTYNLSSVNYRPGITFQGEGGNSKLFKIPATVAFSRMFTVESGAGYNSANDSKPVIWRDLYFDGNSSNQTPYANYEKEHDHMIFLVAGNTNPGRLRAIIENCVFENTVADAVSIYHNVNLEISDCFMRNCFRGSIVSTGGWTIIKATNIHASGSGDQFSRIDIETDGAGYNGSNAANLNFSNIYTQYGFDLTGAQVTAYWDNIVTEVGSLPGSGSPSRPFGVTLGGFANTGDVVITNSKLVFGEQDGSGNRIYQAKSLKFENCQLIHMRDPASVGAKEYGQRIYWGANNTVTYQDCEFICDASIQSGDTANAVTSLNNSIAANNLLIIDSCRFVGSANGFDTAVYLRGGNTVIRDTTIDAVTPIYQQNFLADAGFVTTGWDLTIDNMQTTSKAQKWMHIVSTDSAAVITHKNTYANATNANVTTDFGYSTVNFRGGKILQGASAPTSTTQGFPGDKYILNTPVANTPFEYVHMGYNGSANVWRSVLTDAANSSNLLFTAAGTGAQTRTIQTKLRGDVVSLADYNDFANAIASGANTIYVPNGTYNIATTQSYNLTRTVKIYGEGTFVWTGSDNVNAMFEFYISSNASFEIDGISFDGANTIAGGLYIWSSSPMSDTGMGYGIAENCTFRNFRAKAPSGRNSALAFWGAYERVIIRNNSIRNVTRAANTGGATPFSATQAAGVSRYDFGDGGGQKYAKYCFHEYNSYYNVSSDEAFNSVINYDHDGFLYFAPLPNQQTFGNGGTNYRYSYGSLFSQGNVYHNCRGRALKLQAHGFVRGEKIIRDGDYNNYSGAAEINFQYGIGSVSDCEFHYKDYNNGADSPLKSAGTTLVDFYNGEDYGVSKHSISVRNIKIFWDITNGIGQNILAAVAFYQGTNPLTVSMPQVDVSDITMNRGEIDHIVVGGWTAGYQQVTLLNAVVDRVKYGAVGINAFGGNVTFNAVNVKSRDGVATTANAKYFTVTYNSTSYVDWSLYNATVSGDNNYGFLNPPYPLFAANSYSNVSIAGAISNSATSTVRTTRSKMRDTVSVADFGAVGDGITDDTAAIQRALNYCKQVAANHWNYGLSGGNHQWPTLLLTGRHLVDQRSLYIDRPIDAPIPDNKYTNFFVIQGIGDSAGFILSNEADCSRAGPLFTSSIAGTNVSGNMKFVNVLFEAKNSGSGTTPTRILSDKFLRVSFLNCFIDGCKIISSSTYIQSIHLKDCRISGTYKASQYPIIQSDGLFDIVFDTCLINNTDTVVRNVSGSSDANNLRIINCDIEGLLSNSAFRLHAADGLVVQGNYFENDVAPIFDFSAGTRPVNSALFQGNWIYTNNGGPFAKFGSSSFVANSVTSIGNFMIDQRSQNPSGTQDYMFANTSNVRSFTSIGDYHSSGSAGGGINFIADSNNGIFTSNNRIGIGKKVTNYNLDVSGNIGANALIAVTADGGTGYVASRNFLYSHDNFRGAGMFLSGTANTWFVGTPYTDFANTFVIGRSNGANQEEASTLANAIILINRTGNLVVNATANIVSGQIKFPATANASSDVNTLDDYEEGTWNPEIKGTGGGLYTMGGINGGTYTKIGRQVTVSATIQWTAQTTAYSGLLAIYGLPFPNNSTQRYSGTITAVNNGMRFSSNTYGEWQIIVDPNNSFAYIIENGADGDGYSHTPTVDSTGLIYAFTLTYHV